MDQILQQMEKAALRAGEIMRAAHGHDLGVKTKEGRANFVTRYDREIQEMLFRELGEAFPGARFLGEEEGQDTFREEFAQGDLFVIDPIDGTTNFMHNLHPHVTSIGLFRDGQPYAGVIYAPCTGQMFSARRGCGAFENGQPMHSSTEGLEHSLVLAGSAGFSEEAARSSRRLAYEFNHIDEGNRSFGSAAYSLAMVASGRVGVYYEMKLGLWDYAAGSVILEEAGGRITDMRGQTLTYRGVSSVLAVSAGVSLDPSVPDTGAYLTE